MGRTLELRLNKIIERLTLLRNYPITEYSREFIRGCEKLSSDCEEFSGKPIIMYADCLDITLDMLLPEDNPRVAVDPEDFRRNSSILTQDRIGITLKVTNIPKYFGSLLSGGRLLPEVDEDLVSISLEERR